MIPKKRTPSRLWRSMENKIISVLENEFQSEIEFREVEIEDLTFLGLGETCLKGEVFLRTKYGDDFLDGEKDPGAGVDISKKTISKVETEELSRTSELSAIIDSLIGSEFNNNLKYVLTKCTKGG